MIGGLVRTPHCAIGLRTPIYEVMNKVDMINRRFSVAPMMECSACRRISLFLSFLGSGPAVCVVLFVVPPLQRNARISDSS